MLLRSQSNFSNLSGVSSKKRSSKSKKRKKVKVETVKIIDHARGRKVNLKPLFKIKEFQKNPEKMQKSSYSLKSGPTSTISGISGISSHMTPNKYSRSSFSIYNQDSISEIGDSREVSQYQDNQSTLDDFRLTKSVMTDSSSQFEHREEPILYFENPFDDTKEKKQETHDLNEIENDDFDEFQELKPNPNAGKSKKINKKELLKIDDSLLEQLGEQYFDITLTETPTIFLYDAFDESVGIHDPKIESVVEDNKRFEKQVKAKIENRERFSSRPVQTLKSTFDRISKNKFTNTEKKKLSSKTVGCTEWEMYDEYEEIRKQREKEEQERENLQLLTQEIEEEDEDELALNEKMEEEMNMEGNNGGNLIKKKFGFEELLTTNGFLDTLSRLERTVIQRDAFLKQYEYKMHYDIDESNDEFMKKDSNEKLVDGGEQNRLDIDVVSGNKKTSSTYQGKTQHEYNKGNIRKEKFNSIENENEKIVNRPIKTGDSQNQFKSLWKFECDLTAKENVNCMAWNHKSKDILAVGYGNNNVIGEDKHGMILCWNIKNPYYPERKIMVKSKGVSSIDYCNTYPNLMSVGFDDGTVAIYDTRKRENEPVLSSKNHDGIVWDLHWIDGGKEAGEKLYSVGSDGKVNAWNINKGLESQEIMKLRKAGSIPTGVFSREVGGLCLDFNPKDPNIYLAGSEDGTIYKCSCAYNEHYLQTFSGHSGPVYRCVWDPFNEHQFISCSADWTIKLWNDELENPLSLTIEPYSNTNAGKTSIITDIKFNPFVPKIFGCVSIFGCVELWDMNLSTLKPRIFRYSDNVRYNCLIFAPNSSSMLVGNDKGQVEILKPKNLFKKNDVN